MKLDRHAGRRLAVCALWLGLAGCVGEVAGPDGLSYRPPSASGQDFVATAKTPAEVAEMLGRSGLGEVRVNGGTVTLVSRDARLIDCGTFIQVALGNRAEFPANASDAVLMQGFPASGLMQRAVTSRSTVRLTRQADGKGYAIAEEHLVTREYEAVGSSARSTSRVTFDEGTEGVFPNKTSCRSSGLVAGLLN
jgi:hypothetical protein